MTCEVVTPGLSTVTLEMTVTFEGAQLLRAVKNWESQAALSTGRTDVDAAGHWETRGAGRSTLP